MKTKHKPHVTG